MRGVICQLILIAIFSNLATCYGQLSENEPYSTILVSNYTADCSDTSTWPTNDLCQFLDNSCASGSYINYLSVYYCTLADYHWACWIIFVLLLAAIFYALSHATGHYFSPALENIAALFRMSPDIAGITILALGNGAPNISSIFASVAVIQDPQIALGSELGAGMFVITIVIAAIALSSKAVLLPYSFLRDLIFYYVGVIGMVLIVWDGQVLLFEGIMFVAFYLAYVSFSIAAHYGKCGALQKAMKIYDGHEMLNRTEDSVPNDSQDEIENYADSEVVPSSSREIIPEMYCFTFKTWFIRWQSLSKWKKAVFFLTLPVRVPFFLTVPQSSHWNKLSAVITPVPGFLVFLLTISNVTTYVGPIPLVVLFIAVGIVISIIIGFKTKSTEPPKAFMIWNFLALLWTVFWIYILGNELVSLLQAIGTILNISALILAATLLAWGNSTGDLLADVTIAKRGKPQMGFAAAYSSPGFNLTFGFGLSFIYVGAKNYPNPLLITVNHGVYYFGIIMLLSSLLISLVVIWLAKFRVPKRFSYVLIVFYCAFVVISVLMELNIV